MRILAFDHFFDQDLDVLAGALGPDDRLDVIPYQRLHRLARRCFRPEVFEGVQSAYEEGVEPQWRAFRKLVAGWAGWIASAYRPSIFITPSDAFFYLRPVIEWLAEHGIPTVVVQKETTISPLVMERHSGAVGRAVPFMSVAMTVCSERQKEFWVRAGTDPDLIFVTGQPRFDVYAEARGHRARPGRPRLLYLSYDDVAYLPSDTGLPFVGTWQELRRETEVVLAALAESGTWDVVVKKHPQQRPAEEWLGDRVVRAERGADTRQLIVEADAVVGFQTTALFEAAVAGRPVVYAAWGDLFEENRDLLIPFDELPALATWARTPDQLRQLLSRGPDELPPPGSDAWAAAEEHLGPVDGKAGERVIGILRTCAGDGPRGLPRPSLRWRARAAALHLAAPAASVAGRVLTVARRPTLGHAAARRSAQWAQEGREAAMVSRAREPA